MPVLDRYCPTEYPTDPYLLAGMGKVLAETFCRVNGIPTPALNVVKREDWLVGPCGFYRPDTKVNRKWTQPGINICVEKCRKPCEAEYSRNWSWPGYSTDRTPYGVIAHELGHHCDWINSEIKYAYSGDYSIEIKRKSGEMAITSYCPNPAEWFAEMFRVFVTNAALLKVLRPKTYKLLVKRWEPVSHRTWVKGLGLNVPSRIIEVLENKGITC